VFISQTDGEALRDYLAADPSAQVQMQLQPATCIFDVSETLQCEFVGLRLDTDHSARGDLRIVLTSPAGTRSVLQRVNQDTVPGPSGWTYYSVQHFYESSFGRWTLTVTDENDRGQGAITSAALLITGVPITDSDHDGLDDDWETQHLKTLAFSATDDPDRDGTSNAREQVLGTNPNLSDRPLELDLSVWDDRLMRLSWPSDTHTVYRIQIGAESIRPLTLATNLAGQPNQTEWFLPYTNLLHQFFSIQAVAGGN
jgi:subtilisin-like proprotein convertase family protein